MTENAPVVRAAQPADRERVWPLAHDFATSFQPERASFDALLAAPHKLVLVAETPQLGIVGSPDRGAQMPKPSVALCNAKPITSTTARLT